MPTLTGFGVTVIVASGPALTVTVANAEMLPAPQTGVLQTFTVLAKSPATVPAVNRPPAVMLPPPATTDQVGARAITLPLASRAVAVNSCGPEIASTWGLGVIVIEASEPAVTITVAVPASEPTEAVTVFVNVPATAPAVNWPVLLMLPPVETDQLGRTGMTVPKASFTTAVKSCPPPGAKVIGVGETTMLAGTATGASVGRCSHAANSRVAIIAPSTRNVTWGCALPCMGSSLVKGEGGCTANAC